VTIKGAAIVVLQEAGELLDVKEVKETLAALCKGQQL